MDWLTSRKKNRLDFWQCFSVSNTMNETNSWWTCNCFLRWRVLWKLQTFSLRCIYFLVESLRTQCSILFFWTKPWASVLRLFCLLQELCCCCHLNWFLLFIQHSFRSLFKPWCNQLPTKTNLTIKHSSACVSCGDVSLWGEVDCKLGGVFYTVSVHWSMRISEVLCIH